MKQIQKMHVELPTQLFLDFIVQYCPAQLKTKTWGSAYAIFMFQEHGSLFQWEFNEL